MGFNIQTSISDSRISWGINKQGNMRTQDNTWNFIFVEMLQLLNRLGLIEIGERESVDF